MPTVLIKIKNCIDCANHAVFADPDPNDWFCDDDCKVICTINDKTITVACRPYNLKKECSTPKWCPLLKTQRSHNIIKRKQLHKPKSMLLTKQSFILSTTKG